MKQAYIYKLSIDGMMCGHCEAHVNNIVRKRLGVSKVKSSHRKNLTIIKSDIPLSDELIKKAFDDSGYIVKNIEKL